MNQRKIGWKAKTKRGVALILTFIIALNLWQVEVRGASDELGETIVTLFGVTFVIREDGGLWTWGSNSNGLLGDGTTQERNYPQQSLENVVSVALEEANSYALKADGSLWAWGYNNSGQLGNGTNADSLTPQKALEDVREFITSESNVYAIKDDGSLWAWGENHYGQLGDGTTSNRNLPVKVMDDVRWLKTVRGSVYVIKEDDSLWGFGNNMSKQLGIGSSSATVPSPQKILDDVEEVQANGQAACALKKDGSLWRWGEESIAGAVIGSPTPQQIMGEVSRFAIDRGGVYAVKTDGNLWTWANPASVLGTPALMSGENQWLTNVQDIYVSINEAAYAVKDDGTLWSWGNNTSGQIGNGNFSTQSTPTKVMDDVWQVTVFASNVYAIKNDDSLWAWGENNNGQVGNGTNSNQNTPQKIMDDVKRVVANEGIAFAVRNDTSLWAWGNNYSGQIGNGSTSNQLTPTKVMEKVGMPGSNIVSVPPIMPSPSVESEVHIAVTNKPLSTALEVIVRQTIDKLTGDLTDSDWLKLTRLDLTGVYLESLGGLEKAKNLKEVDLSFAQIDDITVLAVLPNLRVVILKNSKVPNKQLELLKKKLTNVDFRISNVAVASNHVKLWNTNQNGDALVASAEEIIADAGMQVLAEVSGIYTVSQAMAKTGADKANKVKEQLYAKAVLENRELNKELETIVKISLGTSNQPISKIRINQNVKELKEVDKLILEVMPDVDIELSAEQLADGTATSDMEIEVEEVRETGKYLKKEFVAAGGEGKKSKTYRIKMKKSKPNTKVGLSLKTDDNPYNAIFRKGENGEEIIGGKFNSKTRKMTAKIGDDGEYYVRKNEKNFNDIEGLPSKQKEMIKILASKGILQGNNGQFMPNAGITRSEILTILVRLSYVYDAKAGSSFKDVGAGAWYYPYVSSGVQIGVVNGYPDNTFKPLNQVGSAELTKMNTMMLVYKKGYRFPKEVQKYLSRLAGNSNVPTWAKVYVAMGEREGMLVKTINGLFDGTQVITRGQAAEMLYRLYEKL